MDRIYLNDLFDIYGELLTNHERITFKDYYSDDLTLKEIADNNNVSRSAIYNTVKSVSEKLLTYEKILHIYSNKRILKDLLNNDDMEYIKNKIKEII